MLWGEVDSSNLKHNWRVSVFWILLIGILDWSYLFLSTPLTTSILWSSATIHFCFLPRDCTIDHKRLYCWLNTNLLQDFFYKGVLMLFNLSHKLFFGLSRIMEEASSRKVNALPFSSCRTTRSYSTTSSRDVLSSSKVVRSTVVVPVSTTLAQSVAPSRPTLSSSGVSTSSSNRTC